MIRTHIAKDVLRPVNEMNRHVMCRRRISHTTTSFYTGESLGRCLSGSSILLLATQPTCACTSKQFFAPHITKDESFTSQFLRQYMLLTDGY